MPFVTARLPGGGGADTLLVSDIQLVVQHLRGHAQITYGTDLSRWEKRGRAMRVHMCPVLSLATFVGHGGGMHTVFIILCERGGARTPLFMIRVIATWRYNAIYPWEQLTRVH